MKPAIPYCCYTQSLGVTETKKNTKICSEFRANLNFEIMKNRSDNFVIFAF